MENVDFKGLHQVSTFTCNSRPAIVVNVQLNSWSWCYTFYVMTHALCVIGNIKIKEFDIAVLPK